MFSDILKASGFLLADRRSEMKQNQYDGKHLTLSQRIQIEKGLNDLNSFAEIARIIGKHPSTVSKEVKNYRFFPERKEPQKPIICYRRKACQIRFLCQKEDCFKLCKFCYSAACNGDCRSICPEYKPRVCKQIRKAPFVCNGCPKFRRCHLQHALYSAQQADQASYELRISSRDGINQSPADIAMLDQLISPLLKKGQSLAHIYAHHGHQIPCCRKTLYNYIDQGVFTAKNLDLRRRVRYKCKPRKTATRVSLSMREFRVGRMYDDFLKRMKEYPNTSVVEMDTVEGGKGSGKKAFLTMLFRSCKLMLVFVLEEKTQDHVIEVFDLLSQKLGIETFRELFPVILTDNGIEFQFPRRMECDQDGQARTSIYYCNPNCSWQKGMLEKNHEYIRYVIPKGSSLEPFDQRDAITLMNHINSEARDSLNGCTPFKLSQLLLSDKLFKLLRLSHIPADEVSLKPSLLKR